MVSSNLEFKLLDCYNSFTAKQVHYAQYIRQIDIVRTCTKLWQTLGMAIHHHGRGGLEAYVLYTVVIAFQGTSGITILSAAVSNYFWSGQLS